MVLVDAGTAPLRKEPRKKQGLVGPSLPMSRNELCGLRLDVRAPDRNRTCVLTVNVVCSSR